MVTRSYSVPAISCDHCKQAIESEVDKLTNVDLVTVDVPTKTVRIEGEASEEALRAAIAEAGYEVVGPLP
jgi:copper chaperone